jgi:hypothetical protein
VFVPHETPELSSQPGYAGKWQDFPKIQVLREVTKATTKANKSPQDPHNHWTPPAEFAPDADEFVLESPDDLVKFSSSFKSSFSEDRNLPASTESPSVFDIIYMGSRPLKMVFHEDKLILIDPQYINDEEYLTSPPTRYTSSGLDRVLPSSVLQLFTPESGSEPTAPRRPGPQRPSLPSRDPESDPIDTSAQEDRNWSSSDRNGQTLGEEEAQELGSSLSLPADAALF